MSDNRFVKRYLGRKGSEKSIDDVFIDNRGNEFDFKWLAILSSFGNFFGSCLLNGFPIVVKRLWYSAWAFYPFFFLRNNISASSAIQVMNHERIHIRQQREILIVFGLPMVLLSFWIPIVLAVVPFIPTLFYLVDLVRCYFRLLYQYRTLSLRIPFKRLRSMTCFEAEANACMLNENYLLYRRFFSFIYYR